MDEREIEALSEPPSRLATQFLCKIGLHRWQNDYCGPWDGWSQYVARHCVRCDECEGITLINPLSGPATPAGTKESK